jgi:hypothetical protein
MKVQANIPSQMSPTNGDKIPKITIVKNQMTQAIYERFHEHLQPCPNRPFGKGLVNTLKSVQLKVLNNNPKIL